MSLWKPLPPGEEAENTEGLLVKEQSRSLLSLSALLFVPASAVCAGVLVLLSEPGGWERFWACFFLGLLHVACMSGALVPHVSSGRPGSLSPNAPCAVASRCPVERRRGAHHLSFSGSCEAESQIKPVMVFHNPESFVALCRCLLPKISS